MGKYNLNLGNNSRKKPILPPIYFFFSILLVLVIEVSQEAWFVSPAVLRILGAVISFFGLWVFVDTFLRFKKAETDITPLEPSSCLIQSGFFRFSRNPIYLSMLLMILGVELQLGFGWGLLLVPIFFFIIKKSFVEKEEKLLEETFGQEYLDYSSL